MAVLGSDKSMSSGRFKPTVSDKSDILRYNRSIRNFYIKVFAL